jgi:tetratricopeptide (TPR) repeat protein
MGVEERQEYALAVDDYTRCLELRPADADAATPTFERAQAERALGRWAAASADYDAAAELFLRRKQKKEAKIAQAQAAFATFEAGDVARALTRLETLSRQLYSSDVRAALVACYWKAGEVAKAEDQWLGLCDMEGKP